jgi:chemotaxis protein methyltransferase CheR
VVAAGAERVPAFSDVDFRMFADLLREHCGLHFGSDLRYLLEKRVLRRLERLGLPSFAAYHYLLRHEPSADDELSRLVDDVTTNETYFMRERDQLRALVQEILPELLREGRSCGPIEIWSAGCSSGEEAYSIVMLALEAGYQPGRDLRIHASDISRCVLERARRGIYRANSFREMEGHLREKYFVAQGDSHRIRDEVKRHVHFAHLNLLDRSRASLLPPMDVILCRNVIIYFDLETKRRVIAGFDEKLHSGGYLLLGHSESLINLSNAFVLCQLRNDLVYRKPDRQWQADALEEMSAGIVDPAVSQPGASR